MKPCRKPEQNRRRTTARRISYHHPETDLDYIIRMEANRQAQTQEDLAFLNEAFCIR